MNTLRSKRADHPTARQRSNLTTSSSATIPTSQRGRWSAGGAFSIYSAEAGRAGVSADRLAARRGPTSPTCAALGHWARG
eukprot:3572761-Alexandrium_andersonii.AAC.1